MSSCFVSDRMLPFSLYLIEGISLIFPSISTCLVYFFRYPKQNFVVSTCWGDINAPIQIGIFRLKGIDVNAVSCVSSKICTIPFLGSSSPHLHFFSHHWKYIWGVTLRSCIYLDSSSFSERLFINIWHIIIIYYYWNEKWKLGFLVLINKILTAPPSGGFLLVMSLQKFFSW